jgi:hypothetical protein
VAAAAKRVTGRRALNCVRTGSGGKTPLVFGYARFAQKGRKPSAVFRQLRQFRDLGIVAADPCNTSRICPRCEPLFVARAKAPATVGLLKDDLDEIAAFHFLIGLEPVQDSKSLNRMIERKRHPGGKRFRCVAGLRFHNLQAQRLG